MLSGRWTIELARESRRHRLLPAGGAYLGGAEFNWRPSSIIAAVRPEWGGGRRFEEEGPPPPGQEEFKWSAAAAGG